MVCCQTQIYTIGLEWPDNQFQLAPGVACPTAAAAEGPGHPAMTVTVTPGCDRDSDRDSAPDLVQKGVATQISNFAWFWF